jgi:hypothetical protein
MTSDDVLGRIMNHEMNIQEANNIKNLYKSVSTSKKKDIALKAKKSKKKKVLIESPTEEEDEEEKEEDGEREYDEDEMTIHQKIQQVHQEEKTLQGRKEREVNVKEGVL